jgi:nitronate monooxygenase
VLAGGVCDGAALLAAPALDCDFGYMGTPFAATRESLVSDVYRDRLIAASMDEIVLTREFSGLWGNYLRESISAAGYDPDNLDAVDPATATIKFGPSGKGPKRWTQLQSAGHWVSSVRERLDAAGLMDRLEAQYRAAFATLAPPQRVWIN